MNDLVAASDTVDTPEALYNADGVPVNVVVDEVVAVLQVLTFGNTVGGDQHINFRLITRHQQFLVLRDRREAGQHRVQVGTELGASRPTLNRAGYHCGVQSIPILNIAADIVVEITGGIRKSGEDD